MTTSWAITSAMRKSRKVSAARSTAALAASFQDFELVPISSMTLYTLSAMAFLLEPSNSAFGAARAHNSGAIGLPSYAQERPLSGPFGSPTSRLSGASRKGYKLLDSVAARDAAERHMAGPLRPLIILSGLEAGDG